MKNLIICIFMMLLGICPMFGQQAKSSTTGKTFVVKTTKAAANDSVTGITVTLKDGKVYPVFKGTRGGLYVYRVAKKGTNSGKNIKVSLSSCMSKEEYLELKKMCGTK